MDAQRLLPVSRLTGRSKARSANYKAKFMVNQLVLRGSSLATPAGHEPRELSQTSSRPAARWAVQRPAACRLSGLIVRVSVLEKAS